MKISEQLRAGAAYVREHGFSVFYGRYGCRACFIGSIRFAVPGNETTWHARQFLRETAFDCDEGWYEEGRLKRDGWNKRDAIAALEIAADIAECEGL